MRRRRPSSAARVSHGAGPTRSLAPVEAAVAEAHRSLNGAWFGGRLRDVYVDFEWWRRGGWPWSRFEREALEDAGGRAGRLVLAFQLFPKAPVLVEAVAHQLVHQAWAEAGGGDAARCRRYHPGGFLDQAEAAGYLVPATAEADTGFAAAAPDPARPGVTALLRNLSASVARAVRGVTGLPPAPRVATQNLTTFVCGCDPPRRGKFWGELADAWCVRCRQPFVALAGKGSR